MIKKLICLGVLWVLCVLSSCTGYSPDWETSWTEGWEHEKKHFRAFWQDAGSIHRFIDRHLFNYDETDPLRY